MKSTNVNLNRNEIWEMYQNVVKQTAKKFLGDKHLEWVDDITQDAIMKAILNQDKYDDQVASLNAWLYTLTKNLCLDFMGKKKNDPYRHFDVNEANYLSVEESNELEQSEIEHQINTALSQLGERDRMLLKMKYFEDQSGREIANTLNLPENNIPCFTMRARNQLKRVILKMAS